MADPQPADAVTRYGPRKIGEEAFEEQQAAKVRSSRGGTVYGPRKMEGAAGGGEVETVATDELPDFDELSIADLEAALAEDPAILDAAIDAELAREDGPRKGGSRVLLAAELEREGGPREEVVELLEPHT